MKWSQERWGLICSLLHGPEGRQVPRRPVRWMLHDSKFELELSEWKYLSQACCARVITAPTLPGWSSEVRPWKPTLDESLWIFPTLPFFPPCPHHTPVKYSTYALEKSLFSLTSLGHTIELHRTGKHSAEQNQLPLLAHISVSLAGALDQVTNRRAFCPNLKW